MTLKVIIVPPAPERPQFRTFNNRGECLHAMGVRSRWMTVDHCPPEWDSLSRLCWGPTPAGETAKLPCPAEDILNPEYFATRECLPNATWYVNYTLGDLDPYTNFESCLIPIQPSAAERLQVVAGENMVKILEHMEDCRQEHIGLHAVSFAFIVLALIVCIFMAFKSKMLYRQPSKYVVLIVACLALIVNRVITISVYSVEDALMGKCHVAKLLALYTLLLFYECLLGYAFLCVMAILDYVLKPLWVNIVVLVAFALPLLLALFEFLVEKYDYDSEYCAFEVMQNVSHWFTTAPRIALVLCLICLTVVIVFGIFFLKQPKLKPGIDMHVVRQASLSLMGITVFIVIHEILFGLIHRGLYAVDDPKTREHARAHCVTNALLGLIFALLMCFADVELWYVVLCKKKYFGSHAFPTRTPRAVGADGDKQVEDTEAGAAPTEDADKRAPADGGEMELACSIAKGDQEAEPQIHQSTLYVGHLKVAEEPPKA